jgi:Protein of unknown function (DUF3124)
MTPSLRTSVIQGLEAWVELSLCLPGIADMRVRPLTLPCLLIASSFSCDVVPSQEQFTRPGGARLGVSEVALPSEEKVVTGQTIYVPIYSHVYTADSGQTLNLAATLYIRNTDAARSIILTRVRYINSNGKVMREFVKKPLRIELLASMDFFVPENDVTGGTSPSFLIDWVAEEAVSDPIVESVMIGTAGTQGISFLCTGRVLTTRKR